MQYEQVAVQRFPGYAQESYGRINRSLRSDSLFGAEPFDRLKREGSKKWKKNPNGGWGPKKLSVEVKKASVEVDPPKKSNKPKKTDELEKRQTVEKKKTSASRNYKSWDFGKTKKFTPPENNKRNNNAATKIQKVARGGLQRLHYRIASLQHKLDTRDDMTLALIDKVQEKLEKRKEKYLEKMKTKAKEELEKDTLESVAAKDAQQIIAFLRKANKDMREKNDKLREEMTKIEVHNVRMEKANEQSIESFVELSEYAKQVQETHEKLNIVVPEYKKNVVQMKEAVETRAQFCLSENKIKVMYMKCVGDLTEKMEESCKDTELVDEIIGCCMDIDGTGDSVSEISAAKSADYDACSEISSD